MTSTGAMTVLMTLRSREGSEHERPTGLPVVSAAGIALASATNVLLPLNFRWLRLLRALLRFAGSLDRPVTCTKVV